MPIRCEIVSQDRRVFEGEADMVILPTEAGEMGVLPHHAPVLALLKYGVIRVKVRGKEQVFTVAGGVVEVQPDQVTVLADAAENVEEINIQRAEQARQRAEQALKEGKRNGIDAYLHNQAALRRSNLRIEAARRYRHRR
jgi:F-type H+-transporting ATPase subunit epsilon